MNAIFSCKLYINSSRKEKIAAALADPMNAELVQQLRTYLDEEYQSPEYVDPKSLEEDEPKDAAAQEDSDSIDFESDDFGPSGSSYSAPSGPSGGSFSAPSDSSLSDEVGSDLPDANEPIEVSDTDVPADDDADIESATEVDAEDDNEVDTGAEEVRFLDLSELKQRLDSLETVGLSRALIRDDELWLHYNDRVNLNNIMGPVIEALNLSKYSYLEFNRLARSENAIVFEITEPVQLADTSENAGAELNVKEE